MAARLLDVAIHFVFYPNTSDNAIIGRIYTATGHAISVE